MELELEPLFLLLQILRACSTICTYIYIYITHTHTHIYIYKFTPASHWNRQPSVTKVSAYTTTKLGALGVEEKPPGCRGNTCDLSWTWKILWMEQYSIYGHWSKPMVPYLSGWTSIYQLFWCSPGVQGFDPLPYRYTATTTTFFVARLWSVLNLA